MRRELNEFPADIFTASSDNSQSNLMMRDLKEIFDLVGCDENH